MLWHSRTSACRISCSQKVQQISARYAMVCQHAQLIRIGIVQIATAWWPTNYCHATGWSGLIPLGSIGSAVAWWKKVTKHPRVSPNGCWKFLEVPASWHFKAMLIPPSQSVSRFTLGGYGSGDWPMLIPHMVQEFQRWPAKLWVCSPLPYPRDATWMMERQKWLLRRRWEICLLQNGTTEAVYWGFDALTPAKFGELMLQLWVFLFRRFCFERILSAFVLKVCELVSGEIFLNPRIGLRL